jgi:cation diffusion facilitator family transporter
MHDEAMDRRQQIARVLWITLGLNLAVAAAKIVFGYRAGTLALTADGFHSLLDGSSNVIGLVALAAAGRPPDANHPYGHRKIETFAALAIVMMLLIACWEIASAAIERLISPRTPEITPGVLTVVVATLAVNLAVAMLERREARRLGSEILSSDAAHTATDVFATGLVLLSFGAVRLGIVWADGIAAAVIVAFILRAGWLILRGTMATLADERRIPPGEVEAVALAEPGVREAHNVRSRGAEDDIHLDLHVLVDPTVSVGDAHAIGHRVEKRLRLRWPGLSDVVVHVEPATESERAREREGGGLRAAD